MFQFLLISLCLTVFLVFSDTCMDTMITCPDMKNSCDVGMIQSQCPLSCGLCIQDPNVCSDTNLDCEKFDNMCYLVSYTNQCPQTCGACKQQSQTTTVPPRTTVSSDCIDHLVACPNFAKPCDENLKIQCPKSCGVCDSTVSTTVPLRTTVPLIKTTVTPKITVPPTTTLKTTVTTTPKPPCKDSSPNCPQWAKNGFCTNTFYPPEKRKEYCAKTCKYC